MTTSDRTRTTAMSIADEAVKQFRALNPDLQLTVNYDPQRDDEWSSCSDTPTPDTEAPDAIVWSATRIMYVEPRRETATLIDPVVAQFVAQGWTTGNESTGVDGRTLGLSRKGYKMRVSGIPDFDPDKVAPVLVNIYSPCINSPAGIRDWKPESSGAPTA